MLTPVKVRELLKLYEEGAEPAVLAARYGTSEVHVSRIVRGQAWKSVTGGQNRSVRDRTTEYRRAYIESRFDQGCRKPQIIAAELGITRQAVNKIVARYNIGKAVA